MNGVLRPNSVSIDRRSAGTPSATGARSPAVTRLNSGVPSLIDFSKSESVSFQVEGTTYTQDASFFCDGLQPYQFTGVGPGQTIVIAGITYTVAANGLGAYPDLARNDRITDEGGATYLVLAVARYYLIVPTVEAKLAAGRAWG